MLDVIELQTVDSTNRYLRELADGGAPHGTLVLAHHQSAGRGRFDRRFASPSGAGVYMSLLLRPSLAPVDATRLTVLAALASAEAVEEAVAAAGGTVSVGIKWVNDLIVDGRKLAGILCEGALSPDGRQAYVIVGIGLNVGAGALPSELAEIATSIEEACGLTLPIRPLAESIARRILDRLALDPIPEYRRRQVILGRRVTVHTADRSYSARAVGIDPSGRLLVRRFLRVRALSAGEVSIRLRR